MFPVCMVFFLYVPDFEYKSLCDLKRFYRRDNGVESIVFISLYLNIHLTTVIKCIHENGKWKSARCKMRIQNHRMVISYFPEIILVSCMSSTWHFLSILLASLLFLVKYFMLWWLTLYRFVCLFVLFVSNFIFEFARVLCYYYVDNWFFYDLNKNKSNERWQKYEQQKWEWEHCIFNHHDQTI